MTSTSYKQTIKGNKDAAKSHERLAKLLQKQIKARARSRVGLTNQYRNARLRNDRNRRSVVTDLLSGFRTAQLGYDRSEKDATANLGAVTESSRLNRAREGMNAMSELSNLQAGETDRIKGMAASLRNMQANLGGGANDYAAAITNINNSLGDLNASTRTNINNALREQNANNASAFAEWSAGNQQIYADLVDLYGQEGAAYEQAADALVDKTSSTKGTSNTLGTKTKTTQKDSYKQNKRSKKAIKMVKGSYAGSAQAAERLADQMGRTFTDPIMTIPQMNARERSPLMRFSAAALKANQSNLDELANRGTLRKLAVAEGSRLRRKESA